MSTHLRNLRLYLYFLKELEQVEVLAISRSVDPELRLMGTVRGEQQLRDLLESTRIDRYLTVSGQLAATTVTLHKRTPVQIVADIRECFQRAEGIDLKILGGDELNDQECVFAAPDSVCVYSSSMSVAEGLKRIQAWFDARKTQQAGLV